MSNSIKNHKLPYRKNVSCVVFKKQNFLLVQQVNWPDNFWKFPQGGRDKEESIEKSAFRELKEELGTKKFRIVTKSKYKNKYDWSNEAVTLAGNKWRGQIQEFLLVKFLGEDKDIKINKDELKRYKWVTQKEIPSHIGHDDKNFRGYKEIIEKVLSEFKPHLEQ